MTRKQANIYIAHYIYTQSLIVRCLTSRGIISPAFLQHEILWTAFLYLQHIFNLTLLHSQFSFGFLGHSFSVLCGFLFVSSLNIRFSQAATLVPILISFYTCFWALITIFMGGSLNHCG